MAFNNSQPPSAPKRFSWKEIPSLKLVVQFLFSFIILTVGIFQLASSDSSAPGVRNSKNEALYWSYLTGILAWWMPSPAVIRDRLPSPYPDTQMTHQTN